MNTTAVVIGAGVNELVCAHYLARAGLRVLVLRQSVSDDYAWPDAGWIPPRLVRDLALHEHGLKMLARDPWSAAALPGGGRLELWRDCARSAAAIRRLSGKDAARWPAFCERMSVLARLFEKIYTNSPPDLMAREFGDVAQLAGLGLKLRGLGRRGVEDLMRLLPMSVADLLDDWFDSDVLKGILGAAGIMHLQQGPRSGGTAFMLLHHHVGSPIGVFRPPLSNIRRVLNALPGIEIRGGAEVAEVTVRDGRVCGVMLTDGEEISSPLVVSGSDPKRTLLGLVDAGWLDPGFIRALKQVRSRGVVARVTLMLAADPGFSTMVAAPSLDYLERAYDDSKYGRLSQSPYLEAAHAGQSADGRHRVDIHMQYAPYALAGGEWDAARRNALGDLTVRVLSRQLPDIAAVVLERKVLAPCDLESALGLPEGQAYHAELTLDQALWMRPIAGWSNYRTPVAGLYLCGPATHPGSASGISGMNAAAGIIADLKHGAGT